MNGVHGEIVQQRVVMEPGKGKESVLITVNNLLNKIVMFVTLVLVRVCWDLFFDSKNNSFLKMINTAEQQFLYAKNMTKFMVTGNSF